MLATAHSAKSSWSPSAHLDALRSTVYLCSFSSPIMQRWTPTVPRKKSAPLNRATAAANHGAEPKVSSPSASRERRSVTLSAARTTASPLGDDERLLVRAWQAGRFNIGPLSDRPFSAEPSSILYSYASVLASLQMHDHYSRVRASPTIIERHRASSISQPSVQRGRPSCKGMRSIRIRTSARTRKRGSRHTSFLPGSSISFSRASFGVFLFFPGSLSPRYSIPSIPPYHRPRNESTPCFPHSCTHSSFALRPSTFLAMLVGSMLFRSTPSAHFPLFGLANLCRLSVLLAYVMYTSTKPKTNRNRNMGSITTQKDQNA